MSDSFTTVSERREAPKPWTMRFGKYKGLTIEEVWSRDAKYIHWILLEPWIDQKLKSYIIRQPFYDIVPREI